MRAASRRAFPARDIHEQDQPSSTSLAEAIVGFALISLALGTLGWSATWVLASEGILERSVPWWAAVRVAGLTLIARSIWSVLP